MVVLEVLEALVVGAGVSVGEDVVHGMMGYVPRVVVEAVAGEATGAMADMVATEADMVVAMVAGAMVLMEKMDGIKHGNFNRNN